MPSIQARRIGVAFDMQGCPNRCRHCWLGMASSETLSEQDVRWGVRQFRDYLTAHLPSLQSLAVTTWFREPDYSDEYRRLYELEQELSDGPPERFELLSVWRLARDPAYAEWARSVGPDTCQISFFGVAETNDWFYRRTGAFADALTATRRLLDAGMKPRWQIFLTTKLLPELDALLRLVERMKLRERVAALGGEFQLFMHTPSPDYEGRKIQSLRPTIDQVSGLPEALLDPTRRHFGRDDPLWRTESEFYAEILNRKHGPDETDGPDPLWFFVRANWDVFANVGTLEPWWCLGNLKKDPLETIIEAFEDDDTLGLQTLYHTSPRWLARQYGDPESRRIYELGSDLLSFYRGEHGEREWTGQPRMGRLVEKNGHTERGTFMDDGAKLKDEPTRRFRLTKDEWLKRDEETSRNG